MKTLLIYALLLSHLCTGLVFASEAHSEAFVSHDATSMAWLSVVQHSHDEHDALQPSHSSHPLGHLADGQQTDVHYEDHHCHGSAHLVGLICGVIAPLTPYRSELFWVRSQAPVQISILPLFRPPIV